MSDLEVPETMKESQEKEVIIDRITKLFGDEVAKQFQDEEITSFTAIADLLKRDADAGIFRNLGLKYGSAVRIKTEFSKTVQVQELSSTLRLKPTMGEMSGFDTETKRLYLSKRKRVGLLATEHWGAGNFPKFNTPEKKAQLKKFASDIEPDCAILEIGFTCEGICQHIQDYFNEQRRYKKRSGQQDGQVSEAESSKSGSSKSGSSKSGSSKSEGESSKPAAECSKRNPIEGKDSDGMLNDSANFNIDLQNSSARSGTPSTLSVDSSSNASDSASSMSEGDSDKKHSASSLQAKAANFSVDQIPLKVCQVIFKSVFGVAQLSREDVVKVLKKRFDVKHGKLTSLTLTQLMEVTARKLINQNYCSIKDGANIMKGIKVDDITVRKKIGL